MIHIADSLLGLVIVPDDIGLGLGDLVRNFNGSQTIVQKGHILGNAGALRAAYHIETQDCLAALQLFSKNAHITGLLIEISVFFTSWW